MVLEQVHLEGGCFRGGELHRRKCVHVRDAYFSLWEKRCYLLSIVVTC